MFGTRKTIPSQGVVSVVRVQACSNEQEQESNWSPPVPLYCSSDKGQPSTECTPQPVETLYLPSAPPSLLTFNLTSYMLLAGVICQDEDDAKSHEAKLCEDKSSGELFRLKSGKDSCRDVIQCTAAVSGFFRKTKSQNLSLSGPASHPMPPWPRL